MSFSNITIFFPAYIYTVFWFLPFAGKFIHAVAELICTSKNPYGNCIFLILSLEMLIIFPIPYLIDSTNHFLGDIIFWVCVLPLLYYIVVECPISFHLGLSCTDIYDDMIFHPLCWFSWRLHTSSLFVFVFVFFFFFFQVPPSERHWA